MLSHDGAERGGSAFHWLFQGCVFHGLRDWAAGANAAAPPPGNVGRRPRSPTVTLPPRPLPLQQTWDSVQDCRVWVCLNKYASSHNHCWSQEERYRQTLENVSRQRLSKAKIPNSMHQRNRCRHSQREEHRQSCNLPGLTLRNGWLMVNGQARPCREPWR